MKREKNLTCIIGAVFAVLLSWGAVGCMVTGLRLDVSEMGRLFGICVLSASVSALCFRFRRGGTVLLCLLVPVVWWLCREEQTIQQTLYMLCRIARLYDSAYGWGVPRFLQLYENPESMLYPMAILGTLVSIAVSWIACRRKRAEFAIMIAVIPLMLCFGLTDTVPESKYLYIWMLGFVLLVLTNGVRRKNASQGVTLSLMAAVPAAVALAVLFWAVPREGYDKHPQELQDRIIGWVQELPDLWEDVSDDVASSLSGAVQPSEVNLRTLGPRLKKVYPVMEVGAPGSGTLYLRGQDFDAYDGTGWTATRHRSEDFPPERMSRTVGDVLVRTRRVRDVLYLPYYPGGDVTLAGGQVDNSENVKEYTFSQRALPTNWRELVEAKSETVDTGYVFATGTLPDGDNSRRYLILPEETKEWAKELVGEIVTDRSSATAIADTIAAYVRSSARYDLDTQRMSSEYDDFARWFLEESDTGYCVHYATATAVLLRAAGVEARYVEGYKTTAVAGSFVTVTEDQAHAWVEYYEPALDNWILLESTPADADEAPVQTTPAAQDADETAPSTEAETEAPTLPTEGTEPDTTEGIGQNAGKKTVDMSWLWKWVRGILLSALVVAAVPVQRRLRLALRRKKQRQGSTNTRALARWQEITLLYRLLKEAPPERIEALAQKAKYSQHSIAADELKAMDSCIRTARLWLQERPWYLKLIYRYIFAAY